MKKLLLSLALVLAASMVTTRAAEEVMQVHRTTLGWTGATDYTGTSYTVEFYTDVYVVYTSSNGQMRATRFEYLSGVSSKILGGPTLGDYLIRNNPYLTDNGTVAHIEWEWDFQKMGSYYGTGSDSRIFYLRDFPYNPDLPAGPVPTR